MFEWLKYKGSDDPVRWWRWVASVFFPLNLVYNYFTIGLRWEHFLMGGVYVLLAWAGPRLRLMSWRCIPFGITAIQYDNAGYYAHLRGKIHIADLYASEKRWFGVNTVAGRITWPEYFSTRTTAFWDFITGFAYMTYIHEVIGIAFYMFFKDEKRMGRIAWGFFLLNFMGEMTYLIYAAAPPWYVAEHGLGPAVLDAAPSAAGCLGFDRLLGINYFQSFYSRNTNIFGAMPSLHVAYPVLIFCAVARLGKVWAVSTAAFALLVAFSAVYLNHHWVWDVVIGVVYGVGAYGVTLLPGLLKKGNAAEEAPPAAMQPGDAGHKEDQERQP